MHPPLGRGEMQTPEMIATVQRQITAATTDHLERKLAQIIREYTEPSRYRVKYAPGNTQDDVTVMTEMIQAELAHREHRGER